MSHSIHDIKHGGSIHDVKRKKVPLETKTGHFRTWKSGKKWIYGAAVLSLTAGTVAPIGNLAFLPKVEIANAATTSTATLTPGQGTTTGLPLNTPDVAAAYSATDYTTAANTTLTENVFAQSGTGLSGSFTLGKTGSNWSAVNGTLTLQNSTSHTSLLNPTATLYDAENSWATFNPTLNMTQAFSFSASFKATPNATLNPLNNVGNYFGAYFVPVGTTFTQTTSTSQTGSPTYTAISGIKNSFFLGRNYYYTGASSLAIQMSQTDASANQNTIGTANTDNSVSIPSGGETVKITWTPTAVGGTTTTGILTLTFGNNTTISQSVVMQNGMQFGVAGSTGNYGSQMQVWNASFSAYAPTGLVNVKYVDSNGNPINAAPATMLNAKVGDTIGVVAPGATSISDSNTYDYAAPTISGYTYKSVSAAVTASTSATPTITVTYAQQASIAGSFTFVDGTPGSNTTGALPGNDALNGTGTTATIAANVGDNLTISKTDVLTAVPNPLGTAKVTVKDTTNTSVTPVVYTAPLGYYIVGYSYAGGKPVALTDSNTSLPTTPTTSSVTVASSTDKIQFYLAPYSGYQTTAITAGTAGTATYTMTSAGGTTSTQTIANTNAAQTKVFLETTTDGGATATLGVTLKQASGSVAAGTYKAFGGSSTNGGLYSGTLTGNSINQPYGFIASQGQTYASMKSVSGSNAFPTTTTPNSSLNIPGYKIIGVRHSNSTSDISQTTGITTTGLTATTKYASMEAALANNNDQYYDYPYNTPVGRHDFTTTSGGGVDQFAVLYQAVQPTITTKNIIVAAGTTIRAGAGFVSFTTSTNQTQDSTYDDFNPGGGNSSNNQAENPTITGPFNGMSATFANIKNPGVYTVTYKFVDPVTGASASATAKITVVGAYGFNTEVPLDGAVTGTEMNSNFGNDNYSSQNDVNVVADASPWTQGQGLNSGASLSAGTVSNLSAVDPVGNTITPNLQLTDIKADNTGKVTIASGKLNQPGTYSFDVTYTYTTADGLTQTVVAHDQVTVDPPFALPYTGGEGLAMIGGISVAAFIAAVALYATKRKKTEEES